MSDRKILGDKFLYDHPPFSLCTEEYKWESGVTMNWVFLSNKNKLIHSSYK